MHAACGRRRSIRRGVAADACGMVTSGHGQQRVPNRAPIGPETAQRRHALWGEHRLVTRPPRRPPGACCDLRTHTCAQTCSRRVRWLEPCSWPCPAPARPGDQQTTYVPCVDEWRGGVGTTSLPTSSCACRVLVSYQPCVAIRDQFRFFTRVLHGLRLSVRSISRARALHGEESGQRDTRPRYDNSSDRTCARARCVEQQQQASSLHRGAARAGRGARAAERQR